MSPGLAFTSAGVKTSDLLTTVEPTTIGIIFDLVEEEAGAVPMGLGAVLAALLAALLAPAPFAASKSATDVVSTLVV